MNLPPGLVVALFRLGYRPVFDCSAHLYGVPPVSWVKK